MSTYTTFYDLSALCAYAQALKVVTQTCTLIALDPIVNTIVCASRNFTLKGRDVWQHGEQVRWKVHILAHSMTYLKWLEPI